MGYTLTINDSRKECGVSTGSSRLSSFPAVAKRPPTGGARSFILLGLTALLAACGGSKEYPARPITLVVPWGAGGGTDAIARMIASLMEKDLGQPVNVVNRTGGNGVIGHQAVASAQPDGYTLGFITTEIAMLHWQGLTPLTPADFTPIALMNSPASRRVSGPLARSAR